MGDKAKHNPNPNPVLLLQLNIVSKNFQNKTFNGSSNSRSNYNFPQLPLPRTSGGRKKKKHTQTSLENTEAAEPMGSDCGRFVKGTESHERQRQRHRCTCPCSCRMRLSAEDSPPCGQTSLVKAAAVRRNVCSSPECGGNTLLLPSFPF